MKKYKALLTVLTASAAVILCSANASAEEAEMPSAVPAAAELTTIITSEPEVTTTASVSTTTAAAAEAVPETAGWNEQNGKMFYISDNGEKLTGYQVIDDKEYYFAANGAAKCGFYTINNVRMYFSPETFERQLGWVENGGEWYYLDDEGKAVGKRTIDDKSYIFDDLGICMQGWFEYEGSKYYSGMDNGLYTNEALIDGERYYFSAKGRFRSGWVDDHGTRIFYDYDTAKPLYGWINCNGNIYFSSEEEGKLTGDRTIENVKYRFDDKGILQTGMQKFSDGTRYYDKNGKPQSGLITIDGKKYLFGENDFLMQTGLQTAGDKTYFFGKDGEMLTGLQKIDGKQYYFGKDGTMQTGLQKIDDKKYFFGKDGTMRTGWQDIDGKKYCFGKDGAMLTNTTVDGWNIGKDGTAYKLSAIEKRAERLLGKIGRSPEAIFSYVYNHNTYRYMEDTRPLSEINSIGWGYFADYSMDNTFVVCYYFAALQDVLFKQAGYEHRVIYGTQGRGDHYWNQVKINGKWRNFDACMGHCDVSDEYLSNKGFIWYEYVYPEYS